MALYDELCSLCQKSKKTFSKIDYFNRIEWTSLQQFDVKNANFYSNRKELREQLHVITSRGKILKGFYAIRRIMIQCPVTALIGAVCYVPFVDWIGVKIYRWVARNRYRFFRKKCNDHNCSL